MKIQYVHVSEHNFSLTDLQVVAESAWIKSENLTDTLRSEDILYSISQSIRLIDTMLFDAEPNTLKSELFAHIIDTLQFSDVLSVLKEEFLSDSILYDHDVSSLTIKISRIIDTYCLNAEISNYAQMVNTLSATMFLIDNIGIITLEQLNDTMVLSDENIASLQAYSKLIDTLLFEDLLQGVGLTIILSDTLSFSDEITSSAILKSIITDCMQFYGSLSFGGDQEFLVYSLNTQSSGISEFKNYNFNSFSYPLAAGNDGIYRLDDSTHDDGEKINASIRTGITDFGTSLKKQVFYGYLGLTENGRVLLKTISTTRGVKKERWYEMTAKNTALDNVRFKLCRGIKARYWQFEITNVDGDPFGIESIEVLPIILSRRV